MGFEDLSRAQLVALLEELSAQLDHRREHTAHSEEHDPSLAELRLYQVELEIQNRELRCAQRELEEARDRYSELFDLAPVAYLVLDEQGRIQRANRGAGDLFGGPVAALRGRSLLELSGASEQLEQLLARSAQEESQVAACLPFPRAAEVLELEVMIAHGRDDLGRRTFRCALLDVTARSRAERERDRALASERALHECFQTLDRIHVAVNRMLTSAKPTRVRDLVALFTVPVRDLFDAHEVAIELDAYPEGSQVLSSARRPHEPTLALDAPIILAGRRLGALRVTLGRSVPARHGQVLADQARTLELVADRLAVALELLRLHEAEASERRRLRWLDEARRRLTSEGELDEVAKALTACCQSASAQLGVPSAAYLWDASGPVSLIAPPRFEPLLRRWLGSADLRQRITHDAESTPRLRRLLRTLGCTSLLCVPLRARDRTLGVLCFALPARERNELERCFDELGFMAASALDTAQLLHELRGAVGARDTLLALVAHDLRSPLNAISLTANYLSEPPPHKERRHTAPQFELIQRAIQRMSHLIEDLLTAANIDAGSFAIERRLHSARELVVEACALNTPAAEAKQVSLRVACESDLGEVWADRDRVLQVLTNLIVNALKFSSRGSEIEIGCEPRDGCLRYYVRDHGIGLTTEQAAQVFRRYWRGKGTRGGLGLGLFIAERIVSAHRGTIWVESTPGDGAAFYFTLAPAPARAEESASRPRQASS